MPQNAIHNSTGPSASYRGPRRHPSSRHPRLVHSQKVQTELSAGGIIYRIVESGPEFFFVRHGKGHWTFPKGHQNPGESLEETAIREIKEEAGLINLRFIAPVGKTAFRFRRQDQLIEKTVHFFLFEAARNAQEVLTGEEAIWEAIWVPADKALQTCGYRNLSVLLEDALKMVNEKDQEFFPPRSSTVGND